MVLTNEETDSPCKSIILKYEYEPHFPLLQYP